MRSTDHKENSERECKEPEGHQDYLVKLRYYRETLIERNIREGTQRAPVKRETEFQRGLILREGQKETDLRLESRKGTESKFAGYIWINKTYKRV